MTCPSEKCKYFSKWFHCNGRPAQVKNTKIFQSDLIVMVTYLDKKYKDFSKWSHCNGRPVEVKNKKIFQSGLIVMDDLPR